MCVCMPLRLGILITGFVPFVCSLLFCTNHQYFEAVFRPFTGGYSKASAIAINIVEVSGVFFGIIGIAGVWQTQRRYVSTYNWWQLARLGVWVFVLFIDMPLIFSCEDWVNNVKGMSAQHGWNQVMFDVAMAANCPSTRNTFVILSGLTLAFFMYLVSATSRYLDFLDRMPRHLLRVPKDLSSGIFYAKPLGDRSFLDGDEEYDEYGTFANPFGAQDALKDPFTQAAPAPQYSMPAL